MSKSTPLPVQITIDTNVINAKGRLLAMNKIMEWHASHRVLVSYTREPLEDEITMGSPQWFKTAAYLNQNLHADDPQFLLRAKKLREMMFPTTASLNVRQNRDIEHLVGAIHHANDFFLTNDEDFLRCAQEIYGEFDIEVMTPEDFVERYGKEIDGGALRILM